MAWLTYPLTPININRNKIYKLITERKEFSYQTLCEADAAIRFLSL